MKKIIVVILILFVFLFTSGVAERYDFSSMSIDDLQDIISQARLELTKKIAKSDEKVFIVDDPQGISLYLTGKGEMNWLDYYDLEVVVINNTTSTVSVMFDSITINGWEINTMMSGMSDIGAGKKKKDNISLKIEDADISSYSEIIDLELTFRIYDSDSWKDISFYGPVMLFFDGDVWSAK